MKIQISRDSHDPAKHYDGVYQQQGRMLTDADWNELQDIVKHRLAALIRDLAGDGFAAGAATDRVYASGLAGELHDKLPADNTEPGPWYEAQRSGDFPAAPGVPAVDEFLYADVWERPVLSLEDASLRDPGLRGADTCARTQVMVQIKRCPDTIAPEDPQKNPPIGDALLTLTLGTGGGRAAGNVVFRIEVHDVQGDLGAPSAIELKWSAENGAEAYRNVVRTELPEDFPANDRLYEFYSDASEKHLGVHHITAGPPSPRCPDRGALREGYPAAPPSDTERPYVRRWDGHCRLERGTGAGLQIARCWHRNRDLTSEAGLVSFSGGKLRITLPEFVLSVDLGGKRVIAGDYWVAAAREVDAAGAELLKDRAPAGIRHRYLRLGHTIRIGGAGPVLFTRLGAPALPSIAELLRRINDLEGRLARHTHPGQLRHYHTDLIQLEGGAEVDNMTTNSAGQRLGVPATVIPFAIDAQSEGIQPDDTPGSLQYNGSTQYAVQVEVSRVSAGGGGTGNNYRVRLKNPITDRALWFRLIYFTVDGVDLRWPTP